MRSLLALCLVVSLFGCGRPEDDAADSLNRAERVSYRAGSERVMMNAGAGGYAYAYAPSMVRTGNRTLAWACTMRATGGDVIRLTYSDDRVNWSAPGVVLTHAAAGNSPFACDPAVVFYGGYYYLYWGGADDRVGGFIAVSRSPLSNPAGFANYVGGDPNAASSWVAGDRVAPLRLFTPEVACGSGGGASCYGVGQPTVVIKDGVFHMWFTDTTGRQGSGIWHATSRDGVNWGDRRYTFVQDASVDVKWDIATGRYLMFSLGSHVASPTLATRTSSDGITWSAPQTYGTAPPYANNVGVEGTPEGFVDTRSATLLIGYGAPYALGGADTWGKWNLYGAEIATGALPAATGAPTPTPTAAPASGGATIDVRRLYLAAVGDHLLTTNPGENPPGFVNEGVVFRVYAAGGAGRYPIYRCYIPGAREHFVSLDARCEGQNAEGAYGYVATGGGPAIQRCYNGRRHLVTTSADECTRNGFWIEATLGYGAP